MKITYLQTHPPKIIVTPQELYDLGLCIPALLIECTEKKYIGRRYQWQKYNGGMVLKCLDRNGDWWSDDILEPGYAYGIRLELCI